MWFGHMGAGGFGTMLFGGLLMLIFWGGLIALTVLAVRAIWIPGSKDRTSAPKSEDDPLLIAKQRYARGEITRDEFLELKEDLDPRS